MGDLQKTKLKYNLSKSKSLNEISKDTLLNASKEAENLSNTYKDYSIKTTKPGMSDKLKKLAAIKLQQASLFAKKAKEKLK